jgi:hypothetical protein
MEIRRTPLTGRICHVLGHEPRTRQEIALAAGYDGHGQVLSEALAQLVASGQVVRTPAGWHASLWPPSNADGCAGTALGGSVPGDSVPAGVRGLGSRTADTIASSLATAPARTAYEPQTTWAIPPAPVEPSALLELLKS